MAYHRDGQLTLGDLGTRDGLLGGINAVIVGNYLTTLGRDPKQDLALLADLQMPVKALNAALRGDRGHLLRTLRSAPGRRGA